jgi:hypothetical protein
MRRPKKFCSRSTKVDHSLIGHDVLFRGQIWKVISAHRGTEGTTPWLTLRKGFVQVPAKPNELSQVFN